MQATLSERPADSVIHDRVRTSLERRSSASLRRLQVEVADGAVTVRGRVESFYEKQVAIHSCQSVSGVRRLIDAVEVTYR